MMFCFDKNILFIFILPIWVIVRIILFKLHKKDKSSLRHEFVLNVFFCYILCIISVTIFPLYINFGANRNFVSINFVPVFGTLNEIANITKNPNMHNFMIKFWIKNIGGNILLLFPLGVLAPMMWKRFQSAGTATLLGFVLSLTIETVQLLSVYIGNMGRAFDIDDILLNTVGAFIGYIVYKKFIKKIPAKRMSSVTKS